MADNKTLPATGTGTADIVVATDEIAGVDYQYVKLVDGTADATAKIGGDATNGLDVDVTRLPALVAGSANIGDVDVLTVPANPFGVNADAASASGSISAKLRLQANTALVGDAAATATPTGTMSMALAKAAAPSDVSADNDAVAPWALRNGSLVMNLAAGGTLLTNTGQAAASANFGKLTDGTLTVGAVDETGASAVDALAVGGGTPHDAVDSGNPVKIGGRAQSSLPAGVAAGDRTDAWFGPQGQQAVALTIFNGTSTVGVLQPNADAQNLGASFGLLGLNVPHGYNGTNSDRLRTIAALDAAPNVDTGILAVGVGPGWDRKVNPTGIAATSTANAVTVVVDGADAISFHVTTIGVTPGSMIFEQTGDDSNWITAGAVLKLGALDTWVEGSFVPAVNDVYIVRTNGVRQVRYRVNAVYASGTATVEYTSVNGTPIIKSIEMPGAPHKIGYPLVGVSAQYTTTQTSTTLGPTVASTQRLVVTSIQIQAGGTTAGELQVYFGTGAFSRGTSKPIFDGEFAPSATLKPGFAQSPSVPWMGAADEELKVTDSAAINKLTVTCWYYLVTA